MRKLELEVSKREIKGKKVRFLRRGGLIPCNIYGHGMDSIPVQVDVRKLSHVLSRAGGTDLIALNIKNADSTKVLLREIQRNPMTGEPTHVDFYQVRMTEKLKAEVPLVFTGDSPAMKLKNVSLMHALTSLHIEALPDDLPHNIEVDISGLAQAEDAIHVKDLKVSDKVTVLTDPEQMIIKVAEVRKGMEEAPAAAVAEEGEAVEGVAATEEGTAEAKKGSAETKK
jgi:large subunit ribosomal protein L25